MTAILSRDGTRLLSGIESAEQRLRDALAIRRGSYPWSRDYGSRLDVVVDRLLDPAAEARIYAAVAEAVAHPPNGLADVTLREVRLHQDPASPDRVEVEVDAEWTDASGQVTPIGVRQALASPGRRDIWDPALPLGDISRVYSRGMGWVHDYKFIEGFLNLPFAPSRAWIVGGGAGSISTCNIRIRRPPESCQLRLRLRVDAERDDYPGPDLHPVVLRWLALVLRHPLSGAIGVFPSRGIYDLSEPYNWVFDASFSARLYRWSQPLFARNVRDIEGALVLLDPASPIGLGDATTAPIAPDFQVAP